jgi:hypothetical protein
MTTLDVLVAARAEIEKGWCRGAAVDVHGNVCALGAIDVALGGSRSSFKSLATRAWDRMDVLHALSGGAIGEFNDRPDTTKADVLALFDRAIAAEAVKVTTDPAHTYTVAA